MHLAALATANDTSGEADARPLSFRQVGGQGEDLGDELPAVEAAAPRIESQRLDRVHLFGTVGLEGIAGCGHGWSLPVSSCGKGASQVRHGL